MSSQLYGILVDKSDGWEAENIQATSSWKQRLLTLKKAAYESSTVWGVDSETQAMVDVHGGQAQTAPLVVPGGFGCLAGVDTASSFATFELHRLDDTLSTPGPSTLLVAQNCGSSNFG